MLHGTLKTLKSHMCIVQSYVVIVAHILETYLECDISEFNNKEF
jgi:hypothetical protein